MEVTNCYTATIVLVSAHHWTYLIEVQQTNKDCTTHITTANKENYNMVQALEKLYYTVYSKIVITV